MCLSFSLTSDTFSSAPFFSGVWWDPKSLALESTLFLFLFLQSLNPKKSHSAGLSNFVHHGWITWFLPTDCHTSAIDYLGDPFIDLRLQGESSDSLWCWYIAGSRVKLSIKSATDKSADITQAQHSARRCAFLLKLVKNKETLMFLRLTRPVQMI